MLSQNDMQENDVFHTQCLSSSSVLTLEDRLHTMTCPKNISVYGPVKWTGGVHCRSLRSTEGYLKDDPARSDNNSHVRIFPIGTHLENKDLPVVEKQSF